MKITLNSSQIHSDRKENGGCHQLGEEKWGVRTEWVQSVSSGRWKGLEMDSGNGCPTIYLMPLKNGWSGQFCVMYIYHKRNKYMT